MKSKVLNKICTLGLALGMAMAILPVTAFAGNGGEQDSSLTDGSIHVKISLPSTVTTVTGSGDLEQTVSKADDFVKIQIKPAQDGIAFTSNALDKIDAAVSSLGLKAYYTSGTSGYEGIININTTISRDFVGGEISSNVFETQKSYVMYGGTSIANASGDSNKMNASYDSSTGLLSFKGYPYSDKLNVLEYHGTETDEYTYKGTYYKYNVDRFLIDVYKGNATTYVDKMNSGKTYTPDSAVSPSINLKNIIEEYNDSLNDSDYLWLKVSTANSDTTVAQDRAFYINAGLVEDIKGGRKVEITLGDNVVKANDSGELTQTLNSSTTFENILLETKPGYKFTDEEVATLNTTLEEKGLTAVKTSYYQLTIKPKTTSAAIETITAAVASPTSKIYTLYNGTSTVGKSGDENKMNAQYSNVTGKLTFNCDTISGIEHIAEDGTRELYEGVNGFEYFYVGVDAVNGGQSKTVNTFNVGGNDKYGSTSTVNPYIDLKQLINDTKDLADADMITITVNACNKLGQIDSKYKKYTFKINVGTVAEIKKDPEPEPTATSEPTSKPTSEPTSEPTSKPTSAPTVSPTVAPTASPTASPTATPTASAKSSSTTKKTSGWDDGSPFTTDSCGNVFDRWGNKIYEAKGCNVGGYNLVRTSVED